MEKQAFASIQANKLEFIAEHLKHNPLIPIDHVIIDNELYSLILHEGKTCKIYKTTNFESDKWESSLIGEHCINFENEDVLIVLMYCVAINRDIYLITVSNISISYIHRISIRENEENTIELLYEEGNGQFIRNDSGLVADPKRNRLYFVFGVTIFGSPKKDVAMFDIESRTFSLIGGFYDSESDDYLSFLSSVFWKDRYIILFGGLTSYGSTSDIAAFDIEERKWKLIYRPNPDSIPSIYARYTSGITLVSNNYSSQYDPEIPKDYGIDTLFIYGGYLDCVTSLGGVESLLNRPTHEVILHYLNESEWIEMGPVCEKRIPINLTDICTPEDKRLEKLHIRRLGFINEDDGNDSDEFKILPTCIFSTLLPIKIRGKRELLIFRSDEEVLKVKLFQNNLFNIDFMNNTSLSDILISFNSEP